MPKYRVTIEFETDKPLKFPHDAQLLDAMQVQTESLTDGDISEDYYNIVKMSPGIVEEL
jgi:hypothetical protein